MSSPSRKPYLSLKKSLSEFFSERTRYLKESNMKESAFEKPYVDTEYNMMHFAIPAPDWPTEKGSGKARGGNAVPVKQCPGCALYADAPDNCGDPVELHSGIWCTNTPQASVDKVLTRRLPVFNNTGNLDVRYKKFVGNKEWVVDKVVSGVAAGDSFLEAYAEIGEIAEVAVGKWAFLGPSVSVWVNPAISYHRICGRLTDGAGNVCIACVDVNCCNCTTVTPVTFNDGATPDTIAPGGTITLYVQDGCTPYSWTVSGTGYTLGASKTEGLSNTLTSASGTCGVNYAAYATVTVTDACGTVVTFEIRNTDGKWTVSGGKNTTTYGCVNCGEYPGDTYTYQTVGSKRWKILHRYCFRLCSGEEWTGDAVPNPPCGQPGNCLTTNLCGGAGCFYWPEHFDYEGWTCP